MDRKRLERLAEKFSKQEGQNYPCGNQVVLCGVITNNKDKALSVMKERGAVITSKWSISPRIEWELDGERWLWRNWNESSRAIRFYKVLVDENIDENTFNYLIMPRLACYCCSFEII